MSSSVSYSLAGPSGLILGCTLLACAGAVMAADWQGTLEDGSQVEVDPQTHRAWRTDEGHRVPLWDGVHRLQDGSVVIVRDGTAVPSEGMLNAWEPRGATAVLPSASACYELVDRVCGKDFRCSTSEPCRLANELVDLAKDELTGRGARSASKESGEAQCREALSNAFFVPCK